MSAADDVLIELYEKMVLLRRMEERVAQEYRSGNIPGFVHLYIGQEAVAVGVCAHLDESDYVTSTHRGHGHALAKGISPRQVMAELFGRETGCSGGKGGSMHLFSADVSFLGSNGIVGPSIINGAGAAFSARFHAGNRVAVAFFGDGGVNTGSFHEGLNMAAIWELPIVFVCENNLYATEMPFQNATGGQSVAARAAAYGLPGVEVDGQDVLAVYDCAEEAIARARDGGGATLIECRTYRYVGHHEGDPGTEYRTTEEIDQWKQRDPLLLLKDRLLDQKAASPETVERIDEEVERIVQDAIDFSNQSPWPDPNLEDVFADSIGIQ